MVFLDKPKEISHGRLAFISEIFKIKGTIVLKVVPQIILAAFVGLFANLVKVLYCGEGVAATTMRRHVQHGRSPRRERRFIVPTVFRADLAYEQRYQANAAGRHTHRYSNLNVATATFSERTRR